jgi:parallel beta-helix repeat protein
MGIQLEDSNATIEKNRIFDVNQGINVARNPWDPNPDLVYSNARIIDNEIWDCIKKPLKNLWGDGIFVGGLSRALILNNTIYDCEHYGIHVREGSFVNASNNNCSYNNMGIRYETSESNQVIVNNTAMGNIRSGIYTQTSNKSLIISNNTLLNNKEGIFTSNSKAEISNNTIISNNYGILVYNLGSPLISKNVLESNSYGIWCVEDSIPTIQNNFINWSLLYGIYAEFSSPIIEYNSFLNMEDRTNGTASYFNQCTNSTNISYNNYINSHCAISLVSTPAFVESNDITLVVGNASIDDTIGIAVNGQSFETIKDNTINKGDCGIKIVNNTNASIVGNLMYNSSYYGISLFNSENITMYNNDIYSSASYGIYLNNTNNTRIYHNNIINNTISAYDDRNTNSWDYGYPSGGNYWSDYDGADYNSTPNQDVPPPDGLGDTPYMDILGWLGVKDNYPLMHPWVYRMRLCYGWNLISIPFVQTDTDLGSVLSPIRGYYDAVQYYDTTDTNDPWKHNHTKKPNHLNDLSNINHTWGFWIHIIEPNGVIFEYNGLPLRQNQTISLHPGWNMVGYPSLINKNLTVGLNNLTLDTHVDSIWTYNSATQKWKELGPLDYLEIGQGYYIHAKEKCEWQVPL